MTPKKPAHPNVAEILRLPETAEIPWTGVLPPRWRSMAFGFRSVHPDLTSSRGFRWPFPGQWADVSATATVHDDPCPKAPGDALCAAKTWQGVRSGGIGGPTVLLVAWHQADVLAESTDKVRLRRVFVVDVLDWWGICRSANLRSANLYLANLRSANLYSANLRSANLRSADLRSANLYSADLRSADLCSADLRSADLYSADLRSANLYSANLRSANLRSANLRSANLYLADLCSANLYSANLYSADFRSADLYSANLYSANLRSADLRSANLYSANLYSADLRSANLYSADLRSANLYSADLYSADLRGARGNAYTRLPAGYSVTDAGLIVKDGAK